MKVSIKREVGGVTWRITALGMDEDVDAMGDTIHRAIKILSVWTDGWKPFVTHDSASEMLIQAADSLSESAVWFNGMKADSAYVVYLERENEDSSLEVEVMTVYPERLEDGEVPPFA